MKKPAIATVAAAVLAACGPTVPKCDAPETQALAVEVMRRYVPDAELADFGELTAESEPKKRVCIATVRSALLNSEAGRRFALSPVDGGRFALTYLP